MDELDIRERGGPRNGEPQLSQTAALFMQLLSLRRLNATPKQLIAALETAKHSRQSYMKT